MRQYEQLHTQKLVASFFPFTSMNLCDSTHPISRNSNISLLSLIWILLVGSYYFFEKKICNIVTAFVWKCKRILTMSFIWLILLNNTIFQWKNFKFDEESSKKSKYYNHSWLWSPKENNGTWDKRHFKAQMNRSVSFHMLYFSSILSNSNQIGVAQITSHKMYAREIFWIWTKFHVCRMWTVFNIESIVSIK